MAKASASMTRRLLLPLRNSNRTEPALLLLPSLDEEADDEEEDVLLPLLHSFTAATKACLLCGYIRASQRLPIYPLTYLPTLCSASSSSSPSLSLVLLPLAHRRLLLLLRLLDGKEEQVSASLFTSARWWDGGVDAQGFRHMPSSYNKASPSSFCCRSTKGPMSH